MKTKTWSVTVTTLDDGRETISSVNDGFATLDLLGVLSFKVQDICDQIEGRIQPAIIERKVFVDAGEVAYKEATQNAKK